MQRSGHLPSYFVPINELLACKHGERYIGLDLVESQTNHNHEDLLENIEVYQCAVIKKIGR